MHAINEMQNIVFNFLSQLTPSFGFSQVLFREMSPCVSSEIDNMHGIYLFNKINKAHRTTRCLFNKGARGKAIW